LIHYLNNQFEINVRSTQWMLYEPSFKGSFGRGVGKFINFAGSVRAELTYHRQFRLDAR
jgi:hypothetical protein